MKQLFLMLAAVAMAACQTNNSVQVEVKNPTDVARNAETIELCWKQLTAAQADLTVENVVVKDSEGVEIPSQVIYRGGEEPKKLIFQAR